MPNTHESITRENDVQIGSERTFGIVFSIVFAIIALWPLKDGDDPRLIAGTFSGVFLLLAFVFPKSLKLLNLIWFKFGLLLHKIVNPITMGLLFFISIMPIALIFRILGKDPLRLKLDPDTESYWIERNPEDIKPDSMRNQF